LLSAPRPEWRLPTCRAGEAALDRSIDEELTVIVSTRQFELRTTGNALVQQAALVGGFVASMGRSYSGGRLSGQSMMAGNNDDYCRWAGEGGPPD
jgi:hypothetical protein